MEPPADRSSPPRVLVVDDDVAVLTVLRALLAQAGIESESAGGGEAALGILEARPIDLVISDLRMPGMDGMKLLSRVRQRWHDVPVVLLTAHGSVPLAVEAIKLGAADFLEKPFDREGLLYVVHKALALGRHVASRAHDEPEPPRSPVEERLAWRSAAMRECEDLLVRAARSTATVLLRGESGVGKEVAARFIHARGAHAGGPFLAVNAASLPDALLESELFGHEKGAFTGAVSRKPGRVELCAGGTLLLDELGDLPPLMQPKLLRLLQEREFQRVGGTQALRTDARFIAATHRDLEAMVAEGRFREDLLFRVNVIEIRIPPLRERREDVPLLAERFVAAQGLEMAGGRTGVRRLTERALERLAACEWPGNVRQLRNFVERLVVMSDEDRIDVQVVERELQRARPMQAPPPAPGPAAAPPPRGGAAIAHLDQQRREAEKAAILDALRRTGGNRAQAARILGIGRRTLYTKLRELGLD